MQYSAKERAALSCASASTLTLSKFIWREFKRLNCSKFPLIKSYYYIYKHRLYDLKDKDTRACKHQALEVYLSEAISLDLFPEIIQFNEMFISRYNYHGAKLFLFEIYAQRFNKLPPAYYIDSDFYIPEFDNAFVSLFQQDTESLRRYIKLFAYYNQRQLLRQVFSDKDSIIKFLQTLSNSSKYYNIKQIYLSQYSSISNEDEANHGLSSYAFISFDEDDELEKQQ